MRKSPVRSPALQATPSTSTDSRYWSAGKAGVGVNSSMGVSAAGWGAAVREVLHHRVQVQAAATQQPPTSSLHAEQTTTGAK